MASGVSSALFAAPSFHLVPRGSVASSRHPGVNAEARLDASLLSIAGEEGGLTLIPAYPYSEPYEELRLKR